MTEPQDLQVTILVSYGAILDSASLAKLLGFPSADAVRAARKRGKLPVPMFKLPNRKGWFANYLDVEEWLKSVPRAAEPSD